MFTSVGVSRALFSAARSAIESMETRRLLAGDPFATLNSNGTLSVVGTGGNDLIIVRPSGLDIIAERNGVNGGGRSVVKLVAANRDAGVDVRRAKPRLHVGDAVAVRVAQRRDAARLVGRAELRLPGAQRDVDIAVVANGDLDVASGACGAPTWTGVFR